jgi:phenylacetic acid degradation operon negative regulatory protein
MEKTSEVQRSSKTKKIESLPVRTQFMIFTLFGDYILERDGKIWTSSLLKLMKLLNLSERAVRSTLSRMTQKGWISPEKHGRRSRYSLTERGGALLERGQRRIFEAPFKDWDGQWCCVVYSLPQAYQSDRHSLRTQLAWLGFGRLAPGTWISPHKHKEELKSLITDLEIEPYTDIFYGTYYGPADTQELIHRCWDLEAIATQYQGFVDQYKKGYEKSLEQSDGKLGLTPEECFIERFWLTHSFQSFPLKDPNLPSGLLPDDWIGLTARELFDNYHRLLGTYANEFVDEIIYGSNQK